MIGYRDTLENYIRAISRLSGMELCIYDLDYFTYKFDELYVNWIYRSHNSPLCMLTKFSNRRHQDCVRLEHNRLISAFRSRDGFTIEPCHCGLVDIVVPITLGNKLIGGIFLGQVFLESQPDLSIYEEYFEGHQDIDVKDIFRVVEEVPVKSYSEMIYWKDICKLLASYVEEKIRFLEFRKEELGKNWYVYSIDLLPALSEPIQKAINIIRNRVTKGVTLEQVAFAVGYSPSQFSRRFRQETGMTFSQCLRTLRIELAQYLIKESNKNLCEVAFEVGYSDIPSFLRAFKSVTGMTPKEWVKHHVPIRAHKSGGEVSI